MLYGSEKYVGQFLKSLLMQDNPYKTTQEVLQWLRDRNKAVQVHIEQISFSGMKNWLFDESSGNLRHESGKFFSIDGVRVRTNHGLRTEWEQPIINQQEVGILGIITKEIDGILYFLMQAKIEPGNINHVQLSPTLQATKSNYTQIHKGSKPLYLEYFLSSRKEVLIDQLQSEQGARFLRKRNRNIIIKVDEDIPVYDDFCWLTLGQIVELVRHSNTVNMDTRTVISGITFGLNDQLTQRIYHENAGSPADPGHLFFLSSISGHSLYSFDDVLSWLAQLKSEYELSVERIPLRAVKEWKITDDCIFHEQKKYFSIIPVSVTISNREVRAWSQPLLKPAQEGLCAFIVKKIHGVLHFLVQAKLECGNLDIVELAPTVQCLTGNFRTATEKPPFLDYVLNAGPGQIVFDVHQSEEGGRFYREQNRNMLLMAGDEFDEQNVPGNFIWLTLNQMKTMIKFNNFLNIQSRSLLSAIHYR